MTPSDVLRTTRTILLVDYPSREVPDTLARAGFTVAAHGGPEPDDYFTYRAEGDEVVERRIGRRPEQADLVYSHRPVDELRDIVDGARQIGATAVWCETGSPEARRIVEDAGLRYVAEPSITEAARALGATA